MELLDEATGHRSSIFQGEEYHEDHPDAEQLEPLLLAKSIGPVELVRIEELLPADSPRIAGEDSAHARVLADVESRLPPIIVHRRTMRVIDGMHRLRAALMRGLDTIEARFFDGPDEAAFLLAVRENIVHGLPLSQADRERAAERILSSQPKWSDRAVASAAGLSTRAVAAIRRRSTDSASQLNVRIGLDGRVRPLDGAQGRLLASKIICEQPELPLREVAREAGISVATARDVRERVRQGRDPLPPRLRAAEAAAPPRRTEPPTKVSDGRGEPVMEVSGRSEAATDIPGRSGAKTEVRPPVPASRPAVSVTQVTDWEAIRRKLQKDPALKYAASGRVFIQWFDAHAVDAAEWKDIVDAVPPHWIEGIAALARQYSERWLEISRALERQL